MAKRIDVKDLNIYYGAFKAVEDVTMTVEPRSVTAFIGPSGCGKSTVPAHPEPDARGDPGGARRGLGRCSTTRTSTPATWTRWPCGARSGMVFQRPNPFPTMSIFDNVAAGLRLNGDEGQEAARRGRGEARCASANLWNEVKDRLDKPGAGLSGGQQQRLCIARAIAVEPQVLLMDEPCSALDPISTLAIEDLIDELKSDYTIVIVTHNMQQAARVSDRTAFFNLAGHRQAGPPDRDGRHPADLQQPHRDRPPRTTSPAASADRHLPDFLRIPPALGRHLPDFLRISPALGRHLPDFLRIPPQRGPHLPDFLRISPALGRHLPDFLRISPRARPAPPRLLADPPR